jgi:cystathionine beta-lyase
MYAPSKTFNLAGLIGSYHVIYNDWLRDRQTKESSLSHYNSMNMLSMHALIGAYSDAGHAWVDQLRVVLTENVSFATKFILDRFEGVTLMQPEGTYMLFLHCEDWCKAHGKTMEELQKLGTDVGVAWQDGSMFLDPWGIRVNLALPNRVVREAFDRLDRFVFNS